jgi:hypothetical protein
MGWLLVILLSFIAWLWWDGLGAKEIARQKAKQLCEQVGVQFLDDTVVARKLRLCRHRDGRMGIYRRFIFEFSTDGELRYQGYIDMLGNVILDSQMEAYRIP